MRMLVYVEFPVEKFNAMVRDGTAGPMLKRIMDDLRPESCHFIENHGCRGCMLTIEVAEPSSVPSIAEPFFLNFDAKVEFHICMTPEDLGKAGLDELAKKWG
ncbi:MAG: panthothenate synthetase [Armatimonadetes bacterium]|nr:panthothenate synthetase [Armatimonadota bacterium]